jgi:hypothetical protein
VEAGGTMLWSTDPVENWTKKNFMIPAPVLVGIELNPGPSLSQEQRRDIVRWKKDGLGIKAIASKLKISANTVKLWVRRCCKKPSIQTFFENRPGQGRKRKMTKKQEQTVVKKAKIKDEDAPHIAQEMSKVIPGASGSIQLGEQLKRVD